MTLREKNTKSILTTFEWLDSITSFKWLLRQETIMQWSIKNVTKSTWSWDRMSYFHNKIDPKMLRVGEDDLPTPLDDHHTLQNLLNGVWTTTYKGRTTVLIKYLLAYAIEHTLVVVQVVAVSIL